MLPIHVSSLPEEKAAAVNCEPLGDSAAMRRWKVSGGGDDDDDGDDE